MYTDPYYDNYEKTDYGYNSIYVEELGKKANRFTYHNHSYLQNGELKEEELMDEDGHMYIHRLYGSRYRDIATNNEITVGDTVCNDANLRVLEEGYWTDYYEGRTDHMITTRYNIHYDKNHNIIFDHFSD